MGYRDFGDKEPAGQFVVHDFVNKDSFRHASRACLMRHSQMRTSVPSAPLLPNKVYWWLPPCSGLQHTISAVSATGGGDAPEDVTGALKVRGWVAPWVTAAVLHWREL